MPAWRCTPCDISYPTGENTRLNSRCDKCRGTLVYFTNLLPDFDWKEKAHIEAKETPEMGGAHAASDSCPIIFRNDTDTVEVTHGSLLKLGYNPEPFDVVKLNGVYYELLDYHPLPQTWTVERFAFEKTLRQIKRLPVYRGKRS